MSSHGTAHTLRALETADSLKRELRRDYFTMEVDGVHYEVQHSGGRVKLQEYRPQSRYSSRNEDPWFQQENFVGIGQRWNR